MAYMIRCRTSGGVTGTREGWMQKDDRVCVFATEAEAIKAKPDNRALRTGAYLQYWVVETDTPVERGA